MIEEWRRIPGHPSYEISSLGRVRSIDRWVEQISPWGASMRRLLRGKILKLSTNRGGYLCFVPSPVRGVVMVHTYAALAFIGPRPVGLEIIHKDEVKTNNAWRNLKYGTKQENMRRCFDHRRKMYG